MVTNLRSSDNIEQFDIEENEELFNYSDEFLSKIVTEYQTINKNVGGKKIMGSNNRRKNNSKRSTSGPP